MSCLHLPSFHTGILTSVCVAGCKYKYSVLLHCHLFEYSFAFCAKVCVPLCPRAAREFNRVICSFLPCLQQSSRDLSV